MSRTSPDTTGIGVAASGMATGAVALLLFLFAALSLAYAAFAALLAGLILVRIARTADWPGEWSLYGAWKAAVTGLLAHLIITLGIDLLLGTSYSIPSMVPEIDRLRCQPMCLSFSSAAERAPVIGSLAEFYAVTVGTGVAGWAKYALLQVPGTIACVMSFRQRRALGFGEARGELRAMAAGIVTTVVALVAAFPVFIDLMLGLRALGQ